MCVSLARIWPRPHALLAFPVSADGRFNSAKENFPKRPQAVGVRMSAAEDSAPPFPEGVSALHYTIALCGGCPLCIGHGSDLVLDTLQSVEFTRT